MRLAGIVTLWLAASVCVAQVWDGPVRRVWTVYVGLELNVRSVVAGVVYYTAQYEAGAVDLQTGRQLWRAGSASEKAEAIETNVGLLHRDERSSIELKLGSMISGVPLASQSNRLVCEDGNRIVCYAPGAPAPFPTHPAERAKAGRQLAEKFADLDEAGERKLFALAKESAGPLLRKLVEFSIEFESDARYSRPSYLSTSIFRGTDLLEHIRKHLTLEQLDAAIIKTKGKGWLGHRLEVISQRINRSMDRLEPSLKLIRDGMIPVKGSYDEYGSNNHEMVRRIFRSPHPESVRLAEEILNNPEAKQYYRWAAFESLGGIHPQGIAAIKRLRAKQGSPRNWKQVFDRRHNPENVLGESKDSDGRTWQLTSNVVFGNHNDLFIRERIGDGYGDPLFLDVRKDPEFNYERKPAEVYQGVRVADLIKSGWIEAFVKKTDIRNDGDADGLSDLAENRLGTNPKVADSDADGKRDSEDLCPNAAGGPEAEEQKVVGAAIEAMFRFGAVPAGILTADGIKPFETIGYEGYLLWSPTASPGTLKDQFENGVQLVRVGQVYRRDGRRSTGFVEYSCDGNRARIELVNALGGLHAIWFEVLLEKYDGEWYVVEMMMTGQA